MKNASFLLLSCIGIVMAIALYIETGCKEDIEEPTPSDTWDIDVDGIPRFIKTDYIELDKIYRISKFRSSVGHDYSDAFEHCRSMKHYFEPRAEIDWATVKIFSPLNGTITRVEQEWAGTKLEIASDSLPAFRISIFHVNLANPLQLDQKVTEGMLLGTHIGSQTMSDISVIVNDPTHQGRMVSWFNIITDAIFQQYQNHGISSRQEMIISKETRDASPLTCSGDTFISSDTLQNWVLLH
jgi:hypothetical protein